MYFIDPSYQKLEKETSAHQVEEQKRTGSSKTNRNLKKLDNISLNWKPEDGRHESLMKRSMAGKIGKERYRSVKTGKEEENKNRIVHKIYESHPKNKLQAKDCTWKIGGDVRYRINTFKSK